MLCLKGKMIDVTTFLSENGQKINIVFTNYNRPPLNVDIFILLENKKSYYLLVNYILA